MDKNKAYWCSIVLFPFDSYFPSDWRDEKPARNFLLKILTQSIHFLILQIYFLNVYYLDIQTSIISVALVF